MEEKQENWLALQIITGKQLIGLFMKSAHFPDKIRGVSLCK